MITPVLLCGGSGSRLWPVSRKAYPKQFSMKIGADSLFQASAKRVTGAGFAAPLILTAEAFRFIVIEQLAAAELTAQGILIEPEGRNTAPAVLTAALWLAARDPKALMLVAPSDHVIADTAAFHAAVEAATPAAVAGKIVTFGITPTHPETGYGYLELAAGADAQASTPQPLGRFVEKPDAARAAQMLAAGNYLWNAGIFLFSVDTILAAFRAHAPDMMALVEPALSQGKSELGFTRLAAGPWAHVPDISIDYAIMEKAENMAVMPYPAGWSDLGSWDAVWAETAPDATGTATHGSVTAIDCADSLLWSEAEGLHLVGVGLEDIIAVATNDAVLVGRKSDSQRVKDVVTALRKQKAKQADTFRQDHRPWGGFESLVIGQRFQVKRIVVNPGAALSLQSHHHRAEHWIVVEGTAQVTIGDEVKLLSENQSVYVPLGAVHRLANPGKLPVVMIEVQTGSYLGEDDIIRYEDIYTRT